MIVAFAQAAGLDVISLLEPGVIIGLMIGAMLPYFFTSLTLKSVGTAANHMIDEVRRQFRDDPGIMAGTSKPDYARCVDISTQAALREMILPGLIAVCSPVIIGLLLGTAGLGRHAAGRAALRHHARGVHGPMPAARGTMRRSISKAESWAERAAMLIRPPSPEIR